jgi:hypothetical protein
MCCGRSGGMGIEGDVEEMRRDNINLCRKDASQSPPCFDTDKRIMSGHKKKEKESVMNNNSSRNRLWKTAAFMLDIP